MRKIELGRMTHEYDGELVVFLIGMTINRPWRPDLWLPVSRQMSKMLKELSADPDSGMLGFRLSLEFGNPLVVQYWNSLDKLYDYASDRSAKHRPAWAALNRSAAKATGTVGIWHETYVVERAETFYAGTPEMGLALATTRVPIKPGVWARERIARSRHAGQVAK